MGEEAFISYCQKNKEYVDLLESELIKAGCETRRDIRVINPWGSILNYMNSMEQNKYIILVMTKEYLKSLNCMYEGCLAMLKCKNKTVVHITNGLDIYDNAEKTEIISYWNGYFIQGTDIDKEKIRFVKDNVDAFLFWITDLNNPSADFISFVEKFQEKVGMDSIFDDLFTDLMEDLRCSESIMISEFIEEPSYEETYRYQGFKFVPATRGYTFVFSLRDTSNNLISLAFNNVVGVERGNEGSNFVKYYLKCLNMEAVKRNMEHERYGKEFNSNELRLYQKQRIQIHF